MARSDETDSALTLARYRRLILLGKASLPLEEARRIVGPDCAYHLYFRHAKDTRSDDPPPRRETTRLRARRNRRKK
ncbi:MAG: hypothetical protein LJF15_04660 [Acidobacteria bacterium]|jgi:hypothetical protein|nr:hypothetical protein [Acidobacteriota bacterium]